MVRVDYTGKVAREICERIAGGESWWSMAGVGRMPSITTLHRWRGRYPLFAEALAQAREVAAEAKRWGRPLGEWPTIFEQLEMNEMDETSRMRRGRSPAQPKPRRDGQVVCVRYSHQAAQRIFDGIAAGRTWLSMAGTGGMPAHRTLYYWKAKYPEFREGLEAAQRIAGEARFEMAFEVAQASTHETVHSDKTKIALFMSQAAILDPERFGAQKRAAPAGEEPIRRITIRRFERAQREDGSEYVRVIDAVQDVGGVE